MALATVKVHLWKIGDQYVLIRIGKHWSLIDLEEYRRAYCG